MFMLHLGVERRGRRSLHIGSSHLVVFLRTANGRPYKLVTVTYGVGCRGRQPLHIGLCYIWVWNGEGAVPYNRFITFGCIPEDGQWPSLQIG